uniref:Meiosis 1 associated protein n=1 Tax=Lepisosteus oculatus TaxID=7918 RepID=W5LZV7_LEPOC
MNSGIRADYNNKTYASVFSRQPPRILVVDVSPPYWSDTCSNLCEALENFFALTSSLAGPCRLPLLSLYVVHSQQECLLPFTPVKGNFPRLHSCVTELRSMPKEGSVQQKSDSFKQAVEDGVQQFKQYMGHLTVGGSLSSCSVEITLLTSQMGRRVVSLLESGLRDTDLVRLRKLQVIHISQGIFNHVLPPSPVPSLSLCPTGGLHLGVEIDLQTVENDAVSLESFFKAWLHDTGADKEHLHLLLPAPPAGGRADGPPHKAAPVCLKCDVQERLLSPALLPGPDGITTKTESIKDVLQPSKGPGNRTAPLYRLRVIKALKSEGMCESVSYGVPLIIRPTTCWQLDWDELETNHHNFHALCHTLRNREWFLLARSEPQSLGPSWSTKVYSYYVIQPSESLTLLLKPVAVRELLLPCHLPIASEEPPETALLRMQRSLDVLEEDPAYNPLCLKSNLYQHLRRVLAHKPCRPLGQRREQRPPETPSPRQPSRAFQNKVRATVAPLPSAPRTFRPPLAMNRSDSLCLSDDDELLAAL